jgi:hypothetical protein
MYWSEHSFTGLRPEDRCSSWGLGPEDRCSSWGLGPEDRCSLWGLGPELIVRTAFYALWFYYSQSRFKLFGFSIFRFWAEGYSRNVDTKLGIYVCITGLQNKSFRYINKSTAHGCWTLDFFVSDIKLQTIYKVIHTFNLSADWGQHFLQVYWVSS